MLSWPSIPVQLQRPGHSFLGGRDLSSALLDFLDAALHVEIALRHIIVLAFQDFLEAPNGLGYRNLFPLVPGKHMGNAKRKGRGDSQAVWLIPRAGRRARRFKHSRSVTE